MADPADPRLVLAEGRLIPPVDSVTAGGYELWKDSPPLYHDLGCMPYTKYDVQEWASRTKKYKVELVRYAEFCRRLEKEVEALQAKVNGSSNQFEDIEAKIVKSHERMENIENQLSQGKTVMVNSCCNKSE